jgi:hypothetical protein
MNWKIIRVIPIVVLSLGAIAFGVEAAAGPASSDKTPTNPEAGLSDAQRFAIQTQAHARNELYLREFAAKSGDPRYPKAFDSRRSGLIAARQRRPSGSSAVTARPRPAIRPVWVSTSRSSRARAFTPCPEPL